MLDLTTDILATMDSAMVREVLARREAVLTDIQDKVALTLRPSQKLARAKSKKKVEILRSVLDDE